MTGNVFFADHVLDYTEFEFGEFHSIALYTAKYLSTTRDSDNEDLRNAETYTERVRVIGLALVAATRFCQSNGIKPKTEKCTEIFYEIRNFIFHSINRKIRYNKLVILLTK